MLAYNYYSPLPLYVGGQFDLFGFKVGVIADTADVTTSVTTNRGRYLFTDTVPNAASGLGFLGFAAAPGEYITSVTLSTPETSLSGPGITDVQLGSAGVAVPGPIAGAGLVPLLGLAGAWFARRRKRLAA